MKRHLRIPKFNTEEQELDFWSKVDLADYFESEDFQAVSFPNLKPSSRSVSIRLPIPMLLRLKEQANELSIPYQSLIKQYLARGIQKSTKAA